MTLLWSVGYFFANLFQCVPLQDNWAGNGADGRCVDELKLYISECWTDVLLDGKIMVPYQIMSTSTDSIQS